MPLLNPARKTGILGKTYRHILRYQEILKVILRYGFGDVLRRLNIQKYLDVDPAHFEVKPLEKIVNLSPWERVRLILEELGPSSVKVGQFLSVRPDVVPPALARELEKLQDHVAPFPAGEARAILEKELCGSVDSLFTELSESPIASASIAQVHRAVTLAGEEVAVKIQRPNIRGILEVDIEILFHLALLMEKYILDSHAFHPTRMVEEFARSLEKELDFTREAANIEHFARNFGNNPHIHVPRVFRDLSTDKVLTMEFVDGIKITDTARLKESGLDPKIIAARGADLALSQIFTMGFFHADPHGGNIFVLPGNVICFLDYGMMGTLASSLREEMLNFIVALSFNDEKKITRSFLRFFGVANMQDTERLEKDILDFMERFFYLPVKEMKLAKMFPALLKIMDGNAIRMNPEVYVLLKALNAIEGTANGLDPDFRLLERVLPFARRAVKRRLSLGKIAREFYLSVSDLNSLMKDLPGDLREIINFLKSGKVNVEFEHQGLEPLLQDMDRVSNRLVFAIVLASMIIGSSLVVLSSIPPKIYDVPLIGVIGYGVSALVGIWLLVSIARSRRM